VTFLELYNEEIIDLLNPSIRPRSASNFMMNGPTGVNADRPRTASLVPDGPAVREDASGNIVWMGIKEIAVKSAEEALK
jgi:hypothetical protein